MRPDIEPVRHRRYCRVGKIKLYQGNCLRVLRDGVIPPQSIHAVVTDPPYGLEFMGEGWDRGVPYLPFWMEALRVCRPGAHLVAFGGTRTWHRLAVAIEDAGWEIRDCLMWIYGSGFPKSLDVSKAIDGALGAVRPVLSIEKRSDKRGGNFHGAAEVRKFIDWARTGPSTEHAKRWDGWGTALKPAWEPIILARKPLSRGSVQANVLRWDVGGLNIDGVRLKTKAKSFKDFRSDKKNRVYGKYGVSDYDGSRGRFPANLLLDEESAEMVDEQSGNVKASVGNHNSKGNRRTTRAGFNPGQSVPRPGYGDSGGASRFFYCSKTSKKDRRPYNDHPTVKPFKLMRWLCTLVTPPGGTLLDMFCGSGSTLVAAQDLGLRAIGIELDGHSCRICERRLSGE